jgi:hypothetical protein
MQLVDLPQTAPPEAEEHTSVGIYVDDYVLDVVENNDQTLIRRVSRASLHAIHSIFPPLESSGHMGERSNLQKESQERRCAIQYRKGDPRVSDKWRRENGMARQGQGAVHLRRHHQTPLEEPRVLEALPLHARPTSACSSNPPSGKRPVLAFKQSDKK